MSCRVEPILCGDEDGDVTMYCAYNDPRYCGWSKNLGYGVTLKEVQAAWHEHRDGPTPA